MAEPMPLVEITPKSHRVALELAYATADNFTGKPVYRRAACYLHPDAEPRLVRAVELAAALGLGLKIFDGFRPAEAQRVLWAHTPDPEFLADPEKGSNHSRGTAVDLTLIDGAGQALPMGTSFDAFTPLSHHARTDVAEAAQRNRFLFLGLMTAAGWNFNPREWWHYELPASPGYPVLGDSDLPQSMMD